MAKFVAAICIAVLAICGGGFAANADPGWGRGRGRRNYRRYWQRPEPRPSLDGFLGGIIGGLIGQALKPKEPEYDEGRDREEGR